MSADRQSELEEGIRVALIKGIVEESSFGLVSIGCVK